MLDVLDDTEQLNRLSQHAVRLSSRVLQLDYRRCHQTADTFYQQRRTLLLSEHTWTRCVAAVTAGVILPRVSLTPPEDRMDLKTAPRAQRHKTPQSLRYTTTNQLLLTGPLTTGDEVVSGSSLHNVSNQQHRSVLRQHLSEPTCSLQPSQVQSQRRGPAPALSTERASRARPEQNARLHSHVERCKVS